LYVIALPFQIVTALRWITIPATVLASFIFFGFLVAGEEIENPFQYDMNDLDLDHFCQNIIRLGWFFAFLPTLLFALDVLTRLSDLELLALTSTASPDPADWAFSPANNSVFDSSIRLGTETGHNIAMPEQWIKRGPEVMRAAMVFNLNEHEG
jgi:hypothetical protein